MFGQQQGEKTMKRDHALGARIKAAMKAAGFKTAKEFCEKYDIPYLTFAQHTQGRRHPTSDFLKLYSEAFGVTIQWLETGEGNPLSTAKKSAKTTKLLKLSSEEIDKRLQIDQHLHAALDIEILTEIVKQLLVQNNRIKAKDAEPIAKATAFIYNDIATLKEDQETKIKMVKVAVKTFLRHTQADK